MTYIFSGGIWRNALFSTHCPFWLLKREQGDILLETGPVLHKVIPGPLPCNKGKKINAFQNRPYLTIILF